MQAILPTRLQIYSVKHIKTLSRSPHLYLDELIGFWSSKVAVTSQNTFLSITQQFI